MVELDDWITDILSTDPMTFEDAYWGERPDSQLAVPILVELLNSYKDPNTRGKIIELLGESEEHSVLPILQKELFSEDDSIRQWAKVAIDSIVAGEKWHQKAIKGVVNSYV